MMWSLPNENVIHQTRDLYGRACHQNNRSRRWCQKSQTLVSIVVSVTQDKIRQTLSRGDIRPLYLFWAPGSRGPWWAAQQQALGCLGTYWQQVVQSRTGGQLGWAVGRVPHHSSWMPSSLENFVPCYLIFGCHLSFGNGWWNKINTGFSLLKHCQYMWNFSMKGTISSMKKCPLHRCALICFLGTDWSPHGAE